MGRVRGLCDPYVCALAEAALAEVQAERDQLRQRLIAAQRIVDRYETEMCGRPLGRLRAVLKGSTA